MPEESLGQPKPRDEEALQPGTVVASSYRVVRTLGRGGMATVYLVKHVHMHKTFALKLLHDDAMESKDIVARFEREAVASANIEHPNVARATDFGRIPGGACFLVLEYIEGLRLRDLIDKGAMSPRRALAITRQVLSGLGAAHRLGFVHRDLKPENVMLLKTPHEGDLAKVLDFGIARANAHGQGVPAAPQLTLLGTIFGTPEYMPPEQARGVTVDGRADLYGVGVMLFEMIAGRRPFDGKPMELITKHVLVTPPELTSPRGKVPREVRTLVEKLLEKEPANRYADADAAIEAVDRALDAVTQGKTSRRPPAAERGGWFARVSRDYDVPERKLRILALALAAIAVLLVVFIVIRSS
jgi:eukaryotic-like serine/threonine-protein kinase